MCKRRTPQEAAQAVAEALRAHSADGVRSLRPMSAKERLGFGAPSEATTPPCAGTTLVDAIRECVLTAAWLRSLGDEAGAREELGWARYYASRIPRGVRVDASMARG